MVAAAATPARRRRNDRALLIVSEGETRLKQVMRRLVPELRARGRRITTLPTTSLF